MSLCPILFFLESYREHGSSGSTKERRTLMEKIRARWRGTKLLLRDGVRKIRTPGIQLISASCVNTLILKVFRCEVSWIEELLRFGSAGDFFSLPNRKSCGRASLRYNLRHNRFLRDCSVFVKPLKPVGCQHSIRVPALFNRTFNKHPFGAETSNRIWRSYRNFQPQLQTTNNMKPLYSSLNALR